MTDRVWIATDLELGKLTINRSGTTLRIERRYKFLDALADVIEQITMGRLLLKMEIGDVPVSILDALQTIDQWTKNQALVQEGMDD